MKCETFVTKLEKRPFGDVRVTVESRKDLEWRRAPPEGGLTAEIYVHEPCLLSIGARIMVDLSWDDPLTRHFGSSEGGTSTPSPPRGDT